MPKSSIKLNRRGSKKFRLKKLLSGRTERNKVSGLAALIRLLTKKNEKENSSEKKVEGAKLGEQLGKQSSERSTKLFERIRKGDETKRAESKTRQKESSSKASRPKRSSPSPAFPSFWKKVPSSPSSPKRLPDLTRSEEKKPTKSLQSDPQNKPAAAAEEQRLKEFQSSLKTTSLSSLSSVGRKGKTIFTSNKLAEIDGYLNGLAINGYLDAIEFIEYDLDDTIRGYTTNELAEFEKRLKKQRVKLDLYLFTFRHFHESIRQDALNAIDSVELISKWATIRDEKIEFWSKLNQSVYMKIEIESGNYDLVIRDENGGLIKFAKEHLHQVVKSFAMQIGNYEHILKSLEQYMDRINEKKHLTALNLTNLANFKGRKAAYKYLEHSKNLV